MFTKAVYIPNRTGVRRQIRLAACVGALMVAVGSIPVSASNWQQEVDDPYFESDKVRILLRHAQSGNVLAQAYLAKVYYGGVGGLASHSLRNKKEAWRWYRRVAEGTNASTLLDLGYYFFVNAEFSPHYDPMDAAYGYGRLNANDAYLWLTLGIVRHPRPGSRTQSIAKSNLYHLMQWMDVSEGEYLYYPLIGGDPIAQQYHVREAQELLQRLGYSPGPVDGKWGSRSERAFAAWFEQSGIKTATSAQEFTAWMRKPRLKEVPYDAGFVLRKMRQDTLSLRYTDTDSASTRRVPNLVRFVCQRYSSIGGYYYPFVAVLEQTKIATYDNEPIFGSDLIHPSRLEEDKFKYAWKMEIPMELRLYRANLISKERTRDEMMNQLSKFPILKFSDGSPIPHTGYASSVSLVGNHIEFHFHDMDVSFGIQLDKLHEARMDSVMPGWIHKGKYHCEEPMLIPQS